LFSPAFANMFVVGIYFFFSQFAAYIIPKSFEISFTIENLSSEHTTKF